MHSEQGAQTDNHSHLQAIYSLQLSRHVCLWTVRGVRGETCMEVCSTLPPVRQQYLPLHHHSSFFLQSLRSDP